jgi:hypothetical protein
MDRARRRQSEQEQQQIDEQQQIAEGWLLAVAAISGKMITTIARYRQTNIQRAPQHRYVISMLAARELAAFRSNDHPARAQSAAPLKLEIAT